MADSLTQNISLIAGRFAVDTSKPLPDAGGGVPAYAVHDRHAADSQRIALPLSRDVPPRLDTIGILVNPIDNLMTPMAHGVAAAPGGKGEAYYIVCPMPPGPPLSASLRPWSERELIEQVLRPAARVLDVLKAQRLTHRSIRLNNVFQGAPGQPVTLGAAWSAPPAMHQPAIYETPASAMCHPSGRGAGTIADDVYSLGVLMLTLAAGRIPLEGRDDFFIIRAMLEVGCFNALARDLRLSSFLIDLLRGMVADDPDHRPTPSILLETGASRARRVATRPVRRSTEPLVIGDTAASTSRTLAYALLRDERRAVQVLRGDVVTTWLRRGLGDATLASSIEERIRTRSKELRPGPQSDAIFLMHCIAMLSPQTPICWRGLAFMPDGINGLLAAGVVGDAHLSIMVDEILAHDIIGVWNQTRSTKPPPGPRVLSVPRGWFDRDKPDAHLRQLHGQNPLLPCRAPTMSSSWVITLSDLTAKLESTAATAKGELLSGPILAFMASRSDEALTAKVDTFLSLQDASKRGTYELILLRDLQTHHRPQPLPALAQWAANRVRPHVDEWRNRPKRETLKQELDALVTTGNLARIIDLVFNPAARRDDEAGACQAARDVAAIDRQLQLIDGDERARLAYARHFGHSVAAAIGLAFLIVKVLAAVTP